MKENKNLSEHIGNKNGLDSAIEMLKSYIENPKNVNPGILHEVLMELEDYKEEEMSEPDEQDHGESPGLMIMIGHKRGGGQK